MTLRPIRHLSVSAIQDYLACSLRWFGRRLAQWPAVESVDLAAGIGLHKALAAHHEGKDAELVLLAQWKEWRAWHAEGKATEIPSQSWLTAALATLSAYCATHPADPYDHAEVNFRIPVTGLPVPFVGVFDLIRVPELHEFKSGRTQWDQARVDEQLQATAYHYAYRYAHGALPERMVYHVFMTGGPKAGQTYDLETTRQEVDFTTFEALCQAAYRGMVDGPLQPQCSPSRCQYPTYCGRWDAAGLETLSELVSAWHLAGQEVDEQGAGDGRLTRYITAREQLERMLSESAVDVEPRTALRLRRSWAEVGTRRRRGS